MAHLSWETWVAIGVICAASVLAMLHAFATALRQEVHVHDTKLKAARLKRVYAEQLAAMEAERNLNDGVEIVGQVGVTTAKAA